MVEDEKKAAKKGFLLLPVRHSLWRRWTLFRGCPVNVNSQTRFEFKQSNRQSNQCGWSHQRPIACNQFTMNVLQLNQAVSHVGRVKPGQSASNLFYSQTKPFYAKF
jgi:hypothetical protein